MSEIYKIEDLRSQLKQLRQKQSETLKSRIVGDVSDTDLIEYDLRQEIIVDIEERLASPPTAVEFFWTLALADSWVQLWQSKPWAALISVARRLLPEVPDDDNPSPDH